MRKACFTFLVVLFFGCNNDDQTAPKNDYSSFLQKTLPQFSGTINNAPFLWEFNVGTYQMSYSYLFPNGDANDPNRLLDFVLNQEDGNNQFVITAPIYDTSSTTDFNKVFGLGLKNLGDSDENFHIRIRRNNVTYQICNSSANYKIEVLKTEEIVIENSNEKVLKVWFKIDNIELNNCDSDVNYSFNDGLLLAHFSGYKS